jgi:Tfp pilus assembly protein PilF
MSKVKMKKIIYLLIGMFLGISSTYLVNAYYLTEQSKALYGYALTLLDKKENNNDLAIAILNQAIGKDIENYQAYISLAGIYEKQNIELSLLTYKQALEYCSGSSTIEEKDREYILRKIDKLSNNKT